MREDGDMAFGGKRGELAVVEHIGEKRDRAKHLARLHILHRCNPPASRADFQPPAAVRSSAKPGASGRCSVMTTILLRKERQRMARYAWILEVRPGYEEEYKKRHDEIWPEMLEHLKEAGVRNYSIFRHGLMLFGYFETDDLGSTIAYLRNDPVDARWSEWMAPIMKVEVDERTGFPFLLPLQWHMD